jgi:hypothetical protein
VCPAAADIAFILDQSTSIIAAQGGWDNWQSMLDFIVQVIESFPISPSQSRVALTRFSSAAFLDFNFNTFNSSQNVVNYVRGMQLQGGEANTASGFRVLNTQILPTRRLTATTIVILITDSQPNIDVPNLFVQINATKRFGIPIFAIGITAQVPCVDLSDFV